MGATLHVLGLLVLIMGWCVVAGLAVAAIVRFCAPVRAGTGADGQLQRRCCETAVPDPHTGACPNSVMNTGEHRIWAVSAPGEEADDQ